MSKKGIAALFNFKKMSPPRAVTLVFVASILLVVISYGIWQFGRLISPSGNFNVSDPVLSLSITDYYDDSPNPFAPLPNNITDTTPPHFNATDVQIPLIFDPGTGILKMARLEIQLDYR